MADMYPKRLPNTKERIHRIKERDKTPLVCSLTEGNNRRILVVDDEKAIRDLLSIALSMMGYEVFASSNGDDALNRFPKSFFDLVLTDLQMPGMDGLALSLKIKEQSPDTPIILITGAKKEDILEKLKRGSIDSVIFKPFTLNDVQKAIRKFLNTKP